MPSPESSNSSAYSISREHRQKSQACCVAVVGVQSLGEAQLENIEVELQMP